MFWNLFKKRIEMEVERAVSENMNIQFLQNMKKLEVKDGDIIVLQYSHVLSEKAIVNMREAIREILQGFSVNVEVMILQEGMEIGVLTKEKPHG